MTGMLPPDAQTRWGRLEFLKQRGNDEWSAMCPKCGDTGHMGTDQPDRFRIFTDGKPRAWCRRCSFFEFADTNGRQRRPSWEELERFRQQRLAEERRRMAEAKLAIDHLKNEHLWERYYQQLDEHAIQWWHEQGIEQWAMDYLGLGYCPSRTVWSAGEQYVTATYTIPVFAFGRKIRNIRHRLADPPMPNDKYRPDRAGLPVQLFLTDPDSKMRDTVVLCEGEKKSIVAMQCLDKPDWTIVGCPTCSPPDYAIKCLAHAGRVVLILDPDADAQRLARRIGPNVGVLELPWKIDDGIMRGWLGQRALRQMIEKSSPVKYTAPKVYPSRKQPAKLKVPEPVEAMSAAGNAQDDEFVNPFR